MSLHVVCKKIEKSLKSEHKEGEEVGKGERESWETHRKIERSDSGQGCSYRRSVRSGFLTRRVPPPE